MVIDQTHIDLLIEKGIKVVPLTDAITYISEDYGKLEAKRCELT